MKKNLKSVAYFLFATLFLANNSVIAQEYSSLDEANSSPEQVNTSSSEQDAKIREYVESVLNSTFKILKNTTISLEEKKKQIKVILANNLDIKSMLKGSLGPLRLVQEPKELDAFTVVYQEYMINNYANLVKGYNGQEVSIKTINKNNDNYEVQTEIKSGDDEGQVFNVNYLVHKQDDNLKIIDVITEGISMISTQRAEFMQILDKQGESRKLDFLIEHLKNKLEEGKSKSPENKLEEGKSKSLKTSLRKVNQKV
jgi:phospholipid transport system substrate-binding protein